MFFIALTKLLFFLGGPIVGYRAAMNARLKRWLVIAWSTAGGVIGAVLLIAIMLFTEVSWVDTASELLRRAAPVIGGYALFGFVLGLSGLLLGVERKRRLVLTGVMIAVSMYLIRRAIDPTVYHMADFGIDVSYFDFLNLLRLGLLACLIVMWKPLNRALARLEQAADTPPDARVGDDAPVETRRGAQ